MHDHYIRPVAHGIASRFDSAAKVDFFIVEKKGFVKSPNLIENRCADNREGTGHPVCFGLLQRVGPGAIGATPKARLSKTMRQSRERQEIIQERRELPGRRLPAS